MLTCPHNPINIDEIIHKAVTKVCQTNEINTPTTYEFIQDFITIHIEKQIPIGFISSTTYTKLGLSLQNNTVISQIYHTITKSIHEEIWKPSRTCIQQSTPNPLIIIHPLEINTPLSSTDRQFISWINKFIYNNSTSPLLNYIV